MIDVLVIGAGSIGERHVRCFQQTGRAQVALCEINPQVRVDVAERYGLTDVYEDLDEAIAGHSDAAVICTPANLHVPMALRFAEAGRHLLIEKPLSTSLDGIDQLQSIVRQRELAAVVAYIYRSHPVLAAMRQALLSGRFGRPVQIVYVGGQHFPYFRPAYRDTYYTDRATGGGAIQDALTHVINAAEWLIGPVTEVAADAAHQVLDGVSVEDTVHVIARHRTASGSPVLGSYCLNQHQAPNETTITVICEGGIARFEAHGNRWRWTTGPEDDWHDEPHAELPRDALFVNQANAFLDVVENQAAPLCTLDEALQTLRVNLAILAASDSRTWQTVKPTKSGTH